MTIPSKGNTINIMKAVKSGNTPYIRGAEKFVPIKSKGVLHTIECELCSTYAGNWCLSQKDKGNIAEPITTLEVKVFRLVGKLRE